ncbi:hypothetical protein [Tropicibacter sp. S64]
MAVPFGKTRVLRPELSAVLAAAKAEIAALKAAVAKIPTPPTKSETDDV